MGQRKVNEHVERAKAEAFADMGHLTQADRGALKRAAERGEIARWRGFWNTLSPHFGLGSLRYCYGPVYLVYLAEAA